MDLTAILALISAAGQVVTVINNAKAALSATDQATVDAALAAALTQEAADVQQAVTDLQTAAGA